MNTLKHVHSYIQFNGPQ